MSRANQHLWKGNIGQRRLYVATVIQIHNRRLKEKKKTEESRGRRWWEKTRRKARSKKWNRSKTPRSGPSSPTLLALCGCRNNAPNRCHELTETLRSSRATWEMVARGAGAEGSEARRSFPEKT